MNRNNLIEDLDYDELVRQSDGFSGADIAGVVEKVFEQRYRAMKLEDAPPYKVTTQHFLDAIVIYEKTKGEEGAPMGFGVQNQFKAK